MIILRVDGGHQSGSNICVKAEGASNCRIALAGRNFTIGSGTATAPVIYTLTKELVVDESGAGVMEFAPEILAGTPMSHEAIINIYFNDLIDAMVAEHVMGWRPITGEADIRAWTESCGNPAPAEQFAHWRRIWVDPKGEGERARMACEECGDMPEFSMDIAEAWIVFEKMLSLGFDGLVNNGREWDRGTRRACFNTGERRFDAGQQYFDAICDSFPLAICLAALRAVLPQGVVHAA